MNKFDYNKPRNGGYPFTNVNGHTPENSLNFLDWTRRDGITFDGPFKYDKVRNGGYPFTNINGYTPSKSTKFLNWTRRDDNDEPVPPGPQGPVLSIALIPYNRNYFIDGFDENPLVEGHTYSLTIEDDEHEAAEYTGLAVHRLPGGDLIGTYYALGDARAWGGKTYDSVPFSVTSNFYDDGAKWQMELCAYDYAESGPTVKLIDETTSVTICEGKTGENCNTWTYYQEDPKAWMFMPYIDLKDLKIGDYYNISINGTDYPNQRYHWILGEDSTCPTFGDNNFLMTGIPSEKEPFGIMNETASETYSTSFCIDANRISVTRESPAIIEFYEAEVPVVVYPNYVKYSSSAAFIVFPTGDEETPLTEKPWDGVMQYATGNEPTEGDWLTLGAADDAGHIYAMATQASDGKYNVYLRADPNHPNTKLKSDEWHSLCTMSQGEVPDIALSGKLAALFNSANPDSIEIQEDSWGMCHLFCWDYCIVDASGLILPEIPYPSLTEKVKEGESYTVGCCEGMFESCEFLVLPPVLPSKTLGTQCYKAMFYDCRNLLIAPELPATSIGVSCYENMFSSFNTSSSCSIFSGPSALPATTVPDFGYSGMFKGCSNLRKAPETLPATTIGEACYSNMFNGCTSLVKAPNISATTLPDADDVTYGAFADMFYSCSNLREAPETLPATTLTNYCYSGMFQDCTSLKVAPELPATTLAHGCYLDMFSGCKSLEAVPELPATTLADWSYSYMFQDCTSLVTAPALPATTLAKNCYSGMFQNCSSLKFSAVKNSDCKKLFHIPSEGKAVSIADGALDQMFMGTDCTYSSGWIDQYGSPVVSAGSAWTAYVPGPEAAPLSSLSFAINPYKSQGLYEGSNNQGGLVADHTYKVTISVPGEESSTYTSLAPHVINGYDDIGVYYALGDSRTYGGTSYDEIPLTISYGRFKGDLHNYWVISTSLVAGGYYSITVQDETSGTTLIDSSSITMYAYRSYTSRNWEAGYMYINIPRLTAGKYYTMTVNGTEYQHLQLTSGYGGYELGDGALISTPIRISKASDTSAVSGEYLYSVAVNKNVFPMDETTIRVSISEEN